MKVVGLTRGGLAGVASKRDAETTHSDKSGSDDGLNRKKSAEAIVPSSQREGPNNDGHTSERRVEPLRREQKTAEAGWPCEGTVETESSKGARSVATLETAADGGAGALLEGVLDRDNLNLAFKRVVRNGGAAGIDGMTVDEMLPWLRENKVAWLASIRGGWYKPKPVRRVEIPKDGGGQRTLGIPAALDRMLQQAVLQVLTPIFEPTFSDSSYGFRPGRSAHQAVSKTREYYEQGYTDVVDIDLAQYFDTVNHDILINMMRKEVQDESLISLVRKFLKSGVMVGGIVAATTEGVPQGGPLSPLCSNIYLTEFDRLLESRGHKFVRYADDCNVYVKSRRAAERVMESCTQFLETKLKLKVNKGKSCVGSPIKLKFLGFALYKTSKKTGIRIHEKSIRKFKAKIKAITSRKRGFATMDYILFELKKYSNGWLAYYSIADMKAHVQRLNEWLRRRIRQIHWKRWKSIKTRMDNLSRLGIPKDYAWQWANTRKGYWRTAGSFILSRSLTNEYLESIGYMNISKRYEVLHSNH
jgi:group II intron reverse transcriptase/maturase